MIKKISTILAVLLCFSFLGGCGKSESEKSKSKGEITIGSKTFTESLVLGNIMVKYLKSLGYTVNDETGLGETAIIRKAITSGEVDGYYEYTGTGLMQFMKHDPVYDAKKCYELISKWDKDNGITWLPYSKANNTYVMVVTKELAKKYNLKNVSDLAKAYNEGNDITLVTAAESYERPDMMPRLMSVYGFNVPVKNRLNVELGLFYEALKNGKADVATGFATDGNIKKDGYVALEDDKNAFAVYSITPVFRTEILEKYPDIKEEISKLTKLLNDEVVMDLNSKVDIDKQSVEKVADEFLKANKLTK
ncbi:glycine betaine ABC transporter substrate-binding protein [Haloimpatiens sp. FM7315]|uniref:ABC transporter substrate-binding protein n=1 Tax=Haloimpatiens sp. FM7315 TaxID=3298609 RepID=UPI0035A2B882